MNNLSIQQGRSSSKPVAIWLLIGVGMIVVQVLLGGITRLNGIRSFYYRMETDHRSAAALE